MNPNLEKQLNNAIFYEEPLKIPSLKLSNPAEWTYERLKDYIEKFEKDLDADHQVGLRLVSFGNGSTFYVENIGYWGPDLISFYCFDNNTKSKVQLIQNIAQVNLLLMALPVIPEVKKKVGFRTGEED